jgi:hypothetical protein
MGKDMAGLGRNPIAKWALSRHDNTAELEALETIEQLKRRRGYLDL